MLLSARICGSQRSQPQLQTLCRTIFHRELESELPVCAAAPGNVDVARRRQGRRPTATRTSPNDDKHVGQWANGEEHGQGTFTYEDGGKYVGQLVDGQIHGQAVMTGADGTVQAGRWANGGLLGL